MDKFTINKEKYNKIRSRHIKRLIIFFAMLMIIEISFLSICLYIIEMDFTISIISITLTLVITIFIILFILKRTIKINDELVLNTIYEINEENISISNNENTTIEKSSINKIEHYKNNSIGIFINKFNRKIIYSNCIENYNEFYEKLNKLHEIIEYKNKILNIFFGILGGLLMISILAIKNIFPHKIYGLLSGVFFYSLLLALFIFKSFDKSIGKKLKRIYIIGIIGMIILIIKTIFEYILKI